MRVLFTWEYGSSLESIHYMRCCADTIRTQFSEVSIVLGTSNDVYELDVSWADEVYQTSKIRVESSHAASGPWAYLHRAGWTDPQMREVVFGAWASLIDHAKPDAVLACGSPSSLIVAVVMDIKAIQIGDGMLVFETADWPREPFFPELDDWAHDHGGLLVSELLDRPGLVFCASSIDRPRQGIKLNVLPALEPYSSHATQAEVIALWDRRHPLAQDLKDFGESLFGEAFEMHEPRRFLATRPSLRMYRPLLIGHYDSFWVTQAVYHGLPYFGIPNNRRGEYIAGKTEGRVAYRLDPDFSLLRAYREEPVVFKIQAQERIGKKRQECYDLDVGVSAVLW